MFGKLKDKLKGALSIFSKKAEEEAEIKEAPIEEPIEERKEEVVQKEEKKSVKEQKVSELPPEKKKEKGKEHKTEEKKETQKVETIKGVKITYFVHGTTIDNEKDVSSGWYDVELSKLGIKQSIDLKNLIRDKKFDVVFCSDLKRAVDSAKLTFENQVKIIPDKRLRECNYGAYNAKPSKMVEPLQEKNIIQRFPDGESYEDVKKRVIGFLNDLYGHYYGKHIAIVAHKAPQLALDVILNKKSWKEAFEEDWRLKKAWQPGWDYELKKKIKEENKKENLEQEKEVIEEEIKELEEEKTEETKEEPTEEKKGFFSRLFSRKEEAPEENGEVRSEKEVKEEIKEKKEEKLKEKAEKEPIDEDGLEDKKSFFGKIKESFTTKTISAEKYEELFWDLEIALLENNVSVEVIEKIKEDLKEELVDKPLPRDVEKKMMDTLKKTLQEILSFEQINLVKNIKGKEKKPYVIAFFGINGSGKTTSIAKLTHYLQKNDCSIVLAACDTFRAAAIQQLEEHAEKLGVKIIKHEYGSDATAVAYDAIKYAEKNKIDAVLIDTAGRLHSNTNLMSELKKLITKNHPDLNIFVGESITGNDCIEQARKFNELVNLDGVILTKADVDEKGGAPLSIAYTIKKPILFLGVGQKHSDLEEFDTNKIIGRLGL